ncbi:histidine phosphatase family protein [Actibacterium sp. 188UL27-1]|uniref:histidine phosphatase family protein n=1 Tax=Actibacterium sp. 188UL27-1 TaxID=2786961 RepID=UPI00195B909F|nr:histidine phosphatase family protein [Actibacterium sp. 188UL27-1]
MKRIFWVRHGPTHRAEINGWTDVPADLSDHAALARLSAFLPNAPVISSDLIRAVATADAIQGDRPRLDHRADLRELHFGAWEGQRFDTLDAANSALMRSYWEAPGHQRAPGGESWNDLCARIGAAADALIADVDTIVAVAHMGAILTQVQRANGKSAYDTLAQRISNLSVTELTYDGTWHLVRVDHCP